MDIASVASHKPDAQGLYDPRNEHDACGMGFVANIKGERSRAIVDQGLEVLRRLVAGQRPTDIAHALHLSVKTVETHVSAVLRKLQLSNRSELSRWASERRLI